MEHSRPEHSPMLWLKPNKNQLQTANDKIKNCNGCWRFSHSHQADTICIHGDGKMWLSLLPNITTKLKAEEIQIAASINKTRTSALMAPSQARYLHPGVFLRQQQSSTTKLFSKLLALLISVISRHRAATQYLAHSCRKKKCARHYRQWRGAAARLFLCRCWLY